MGINRSKLASVSSQSSANDDISFDDFQILRAIGKGSFGKVCIVQKRDTQQMFAMKYMSKSQCIERDAFRNVFREIEILAKLEHPFLVNLWFTFQDEEDMFMVVDLLLGGDLRYHLQQEGFFNEDRVSLYLCEVALALDYLQSQRILHRDIKPDNILLDESGHVHITDFNIAIELGDEPNHLATSMSGTKPYMAPEVFECALDHIPGYSFPADWWSLGCCAYEMLCGQRPFDIHSITPLDQVLVMQRSECLSFPPHVSHSFAHVIQRLLIPGQNNRIKCIDDLKRCSAMSAVDFDRVHNREIVPKFVPPKDQLNCDPTFELEEMIIEANPLHKKKKRLSKQQSMRKIALEHQNSSTFSDSGGAGNSGDEEATAVEKCLENINQQFIVYNREKELHRRKMAERERQWEEELQKVINE